MKIQLILQFNNKVFLIVFLQSNDPGSTHSKIEHIFILIKDLEPAHRDTSTYAIKYTYIKLIPRYSEKHCNLHVLVWGN